MLECIQKLYCGGAQLNRVYNSKFFRFNYESQAHLQTRHKAGYLQTLGKKWLYHFFVHSNISYRTTF